MPIGTTRFFTTNKATASNVTYAAYLVDSMTPANFIAGHGIANLYGADRYAVATFDGDANGTSDIYLFAEWPSNISASYFGLLNLDTGGTGKPWFIYFDVAGPTAYTTSVSCTWSGNTISRASGSFLTDGVVGGVLAAGSGIAPLSIVNSMAGDGRSLTVTTTANSGSGTVSFYTWSGSYGISNAAGSLHDGYVASGTVSSTRRIRVRLVMNTTAASFSLSRLLVSANPTDLGIAYSAGTTDAITRTRTHTETAGGNPITNEPGRPYRRLSLNFKSVPSSIVGYLTLAATSAPSIILMADGTLADYDLDGDAMVRTIQWGAPDLYDVVLPIRTLP